MKEIQGESIFHGTFPIIAIMPYKQRPDYAIIIGGGTASLDLTKPSIIVVPKKEIEQASIEIPTYYGFSSSEGINLKLTMLNHHDTSTKEKLTSDPTCVYLAELQRVSKNPFVSDSVSNSDHAEARFVSGAGPRVDFRVKLGNGIQDYEKLESILSKEKPPFLAFSVVVYH